MHVRKIRKVCCHADYETAIQAARIHHSIKLARRLSSKEEDEIKAAGPMASRGAISCTPAPHAISFTPDAEERDSSAAAPAAPSHANASIIESHEPPKAAAPFSKMESGAGACTRWLTRSGSHRLRQDQEP